MDCVGCFKCRLWGKLQVSRVLSLGCVWKHLIRWESGVQMRFSGTGQLLDAGLLVSLPSPVGRKQRADPSSLGLAAAASCLCSRKPD